MSEEKFKQAYWDDHGIMRELDEEMTAEQIKNWGKAQIEIEKRKHVRAVCPFCLYVGTLDKFTTFNKDKKIAIMLECPECGAGMREKTTKVFDKGPMEYSKWFWSKFYLSFKHEKEKLIFESVKRVVREFGFTHIFWNVQKALKAKYSAESTGQQQERRDGSASIKREINYDRKVSGPMDDFLPDEE